MTHAHDAGGSHANPTRRGGNALLNANSPYLLQHAYNPVDWHPWGQAAFDLARTRDVPIFLSIGYSTCYWCHVMERESFENESIAQIMNEKFICIKVDREEHPDVDELYMAATVMMTGHGGWPMSVFLEPHSLKPFYCGTYFPATSKPEFGRPAFPQLLEAMSQAWIDQREGVIEQARRVAQAVEEHLGSAAHAEVASLGQAQVTDAVSGLLKMFDRTNGGFGSEPKFPQVVFIEYLMDVQSLAADDSTADAVNEAVRRTLNGMMIGGIHDQIGGGFHRYSVDATWTVPHFEKMLYDNAQLANIYARAAARDGDAEYERVARRTIEYCLREMQDKASGLFYSAQDAEVDAREGLNYLWNSGEMKHSLKEPLEGEGLGQSARSAREEKAVDASDSWREWSGDGAGGLTGLSDGDLAERLYGLDKGPNFRDPHHANEPPRCIPRLTDRLERLAPTYGLLPGMLFERVDAINQRLLAIRMKRKQAGLDDKVIASWNGLMIGALARCAYVMNEERYLKEAGRSADAVFEPKNGLWSDADGGRLMRSARNGKTSGASDGSGGSGGGGGSGGVLEDYAFMIQGLLEVHRAESAAQWGNDGRRFAQVQRLEAIVCAQFVGEGGELFDTREGEKDLFVRARNTHDGAIPCGASVMIHNWLDMAEMTGESMYTQRAMRALTAISKAVNQSPVGTINSTRALLRLLIAGEEAAIDSSAIDNEPSESISGYSEPTPRTPPTRPSLRTAREVDPVEIYASVDNIQVGPELPAKLSIVVKIAQGWHIAAAGAAGGLSGMRVFITGGSGVAVYADYPAGTPFDPNIPGIAPTQVYEGTFEMDLVVEDIAGESGQWKGRPLIAVSYQACNTGECLAPAIVELDIALDRVN